MHHVHLLLHLTLAAVSLGACAHQPPPSSQNVASHYELQGQRGAEAVTTPGYVSHYQRQIIVAGGMNTPSSPCAQSFDEVMDHLETLMAPQIAQNNRIAAAQAVNSSYEF